MALKDLIRTILGRTIEYGDRRSKSSNEMSIKHIAFISYRRNGGYFIAELLKQYLKYKNIEAFMDIHNAQGDWKKCIMEMIPSTPVFILVVTHDMFRDKQKENIEDWCEIEIGIALEDRGKNIIQFVVNENGINVPDNNGGSQARDSFINTAFRYLNPQYKEKLNKYQRSFYSRDYPDASLEDLLKKIKGEKGIV
ncbi:MAG: TIR domain-containing protein [Prevotella sp.]|nr:TIR domain-containing protein [Prevotella sp.]